MRGASSGDDASGGRSTPTGNRGKRTTANKTPASSNTRKTRHAKEAEEQEKLKTSVMQFKAVKQGISDCFTAPEFLQKLVGALAPHATDGAAKRAIASALAKESTAWTDSAKTKGAAAEQAIITNLLTPKVTAACKVMTKNDHGLGLEMLGCS